MVGGVHGFSFPNERLCPSTLMQMFHKSEIVLVEQKIKLGRALLHGGVNDILKKKIGCRTPHPDHFLVIKMNFTHYIYKLLYVRAIKRMSLTVSVVVLYFFPCRRKFQFLPGCFLHPVRYQFICDITL